MDKKKAILLRISPELWNALNVWARDELRSLNAQVEYVLREAVRRRRGTRELGVFSPDSPPPMAAIAPPESEAGDFGEESRANPSKASAPPEVASIYSPEEVKAIVDAVLASEAADREAAKRSSETGATTSAGGAASSEHTALPPPKGEAPSTDTRG